MPDHAYPLVNTAPCAHALWAGLVPVVSRLLYLNWRRTPVALGLDPRLGHHQRLAALEQHLDLVSLNWDPRADLWRGWGWLRKLDAEFLAGFLRHYDMHTVNAGDPDEQVICRFIDTNLSAILAAMSSFGSPDFCRYREFLLARIVGTVLAEVERLRVDQEQAYLANDISALIGAVQFSPIWNTEIGHHQRLGDMLYGDSGKISKVLTEALTLVIEVAENGTFHATLGGHEDADVTDAMNELSLVHRQLLYQLTLGVKLPPLFSSDNPTAESKRRNDGFKVIEKRFAAIAKLTPIPALVAPSVARVEVGDHGPKATQTLKIPDKRFMVQAVGGPGTQSVASG